MLLRRPAREQRHEAPFVDKRHVLGAHALVVDHVAAGDRLALELRQRRRVADDERVGHHPQARAVEERRRPIACPIRGFSVSGGRRACIIGTSVSAMNCALPAPSSSTGPANSSPIGATRAAVDADRQLPSRAATRSAAGRQIADRAFDGAERLPHRHPVAGLRLGIHRERRNLDGRDGPEAFAVQVVPRSVHLRDCHLREIDVALSREHRRRLLHPQPRRRDAVRNPAAAAAATSSRRASLWKNPESDRSRCGSGTPPSCARTS